MPKFNTAASASRATGTRTPSARGRGSKWSLGQKVKLSIVSGKEPVWYDAEIIDVKLSKGDAVPVTRYVVHYIGWDPVYDVTLTESEAEKRMRPAGGGGGGVAQKRANPEPVAQTPAAPAKRANISPVVVNKVARGRPGRPPGSGKPKGRPGRPPGSGKKPAPVAQKQRATPEAAAVSTSAPIAQVKQWEKELDGLYAARTARFGEALGDIQAGYRKRFKASAEKLSKAKSKTEINGEVERSRQLWSRAKKFIENKAGLDTLSAKIRAQAVEAFGGLD